ncbi:MAG: deoxyribose-phosphate aldolase [Clostridia bacterium]|nr:deoxyribose-phosphate aldolase [Clostridia bacterium]
MKLVKPLNKYFDHTLLKPEATLPQIEKLCMEAKEYDFYSVCVNTCYVEKCAELLKGTDVKIAAVIGFPLGACTTATKVFEAEEAFRKGASEVDMVLNVGVFKDGNDEFIVNDIRAVVEKAKEYRGIVKVILETCLLTKEEIKKASELSITAGAQFVKTSTGFNKYGALAEDVEIMKNTVGDSLEVKASGGIRDLDTCLKMIEAGATRIGASASVQIMKDYEGK